jgi:hypothetical protein
MICDRRLARPFWRTIADCLLTLSITIGRGTAHRSIGSITIVLVAKMFAREISSKCFGPARREECSIGVYLSGQRS